MTGPTQEQANMLPRTAMLSETFFSSQDIEKSLKLEKIVSQLHGHEVPVILNPQPASAPLSEFDTKYLDVMCFPCLFPTTEGSMFAKETSKAKDIKAGIHHLTRFADCQPGMIPKFMFVLLFCFAY